MSACPSLTSRRSFFARLARTCIGLMAMAGVLLAPVTAVQAQEQSSVSLIRDTEIEEILRQDANPVFLAAGLRPDDITIHIVGDKELNAFVAVGQNLFLNVGLIIETKTPNELIGVIAHETGHIAGGHIARSGSGMRGAMAPMIVSLGLGILAAIAGAPDAAAALIMSSPYFGQLSLLGYSRVQESAADQAGLTFLEKSGQSGRGLVEFFNNFRYQEVISEARRYPFFRSHPLSGERIDALQARAESQSNWGATDSPEAMLLHAIMKAKLEAFFNPPAQTFVEYPESNRSYPARYARAIAYYRNTEPEKALAALDALITEQPRNPYLWELKGQVLFEAGRAAEAVPAHLRSVQLKPDAPLLLINLGQAILALDDNARIDEAIGYINRSMDLENDNPLGWRLLSEAYDRKGDAGMARLAAAEQNFALGNMRDAQTFATRARELLPKDTPQWRRAQDIISVASRGADTQAGQGQQPERP